MIVGTSLAWRALMEAVEKIAPANAPVLIQGEAGTGKTLVARALHRLSHRRDAPFLVINCGEVSGRTLESELFGHEKGAFTGATTAKRGLIAKAKDGTLFLGEISEMKGSVQGSLLLVIDRGEYRQMGGTQTLRSNVRFVAASNRDLQELVLTGRFRDDLLYRINTVTLKVPPLRERPEDIPRLADYFLQVLPRPPVPVRQFSKEAIKALLAYHWPGNVRELRNVVERLLLLSPAGKKDPIDEDELASVLHPTGALDGPSAHCGSLEEVEKTHILRVLKEQKGNKAQTARILRID